MTRRRHRAFTLLHLLAAMPLAVGVSAVATQVIDRALRVQRVATYQTMNDSAMHSLVGQLQKDARGARGVTMDPARPGKRIRLDIPQRTIVYEVEDGAVKRSAGADDNSASSSTWRFKNGAIAFQIEEFEGGGQVVWTEFEYRFDIKRGIERTRRLAVAAAVATGEVP